MRTAKQLKIDLLEMDAQIRTAASAGDYDALVGLEVGYRAIEKEILFAEAEDHGPDCDCFSCHCDRMTPEETAKEHRAEMAAESAWLVYAERPDLEDESYRSL